VKLKIENGLVTEVIVAEQDVIDSGLFGSPSQWVQTSYNTQENAHLLGGTPLRGNFAGYGYTYDAVNDVFVPPSPFPSWTLNNEVWRWDPPIPHPTDGKNYKWDEETTSWIEIPEVQPDLPE
jgi:hypothetical protein